MGSLGGLFGPCFSRFGLVFWKVAGQQSGQRSGQRSGQQVASLKVLRPSWMHSLGAQAFGQSWRLLETAWARLGRSWALLGRSWSHLGRCRGALGRSWGTLGRVLGTLGGVLVALGSGMGGVAVVLDASWALSVQSWRHLGLGGFRGALGRILCAMRWPEAFTRISNLSTVSHLRLWRGGRG